MRTLIKRSVLAIALGISGAAWAQVDATDISARDLTAEPAAPGTYDVKLRGGVGTFLGDIGEDLGAGPLWGVQLNGNLARGFGYELAYEGSRNPVENDSPLGGEDSAIWRNGVSAMAKVYAPVQTIRPFLGAGIGTSYVNPNEPAEQAFRNDVMVEAPLAAGLELDSDRGFSAGLRASYHFLMSEEFAPLSGSGEGGMLTGELSVGGRF